MCLPTTEAYVLGASSTGSSSKVGGEGGWGDESCLTSVELENEGACSSE